MHGVGQGSKAMQYHDKNCIWEPVPSRPNYSLNRCRIFNCNAFACPFSDKREGPSTATIAMKCNWGHVCREGEPFPIYDYLFSNFCIVLLTKNGSSARFVTQIQKRIVFHLLLFIIRIIVLTFQTAGTSLQPNVRPSTHPSPLLFPSGTRQICAEHVLISVAIYCWMICAHALAGQVVFTCLGVQRYIQSICS